MQTQQRDVLMWALKNNFPITEEQLGQLERYQELLVQWNQKINLTALTLPQQIQQYHFIDSLELLRQIQTQLPRMNAPISLLDVGSGAGFPGMICALFDKELHVSLVEKTYKKTVFLETVKRSLGLLVQILAQDIKTIKDLYQVVVSRAAFPQKEWLEVACNHTIPGGHIYSMISEKQFDKTLTNDTKNLKFLNTYTYFVENNKRYILSWMKI